MANARQNIVTDLKTALTEYVQQRINTFVDPHGVVAVDTNHIEFTVNPTSTLDLFQLFPLPSAIPLPTISLQRVAYTFDSTELVVATRAYGSQTVIPSVLDLQNIVFSFSVMLQDVNTLVVVFNGDFILGGTIIPVEATYTHASKEIAVRATVSGLAINIQSAATQLVSLNLPSALSGSIAVPTFTISGRVTSSENELIISATGGDIDVFIIYKKADKSRKAIAVEMSIGLASILNDVAGLDISGIPFFGSVTTTIGLTYATDSITGLPSGIFPSGSLLSTLGNSIDAALTAIIVFPSSFASGPIKLRYSGGVPMFTPVTPESLNVQSLISAIPTINLGSDIRLSSEVGLSGLLQLSIDMFVLNVQTKSVQIAVSYPGSITAFNGFLTVTNLMVFVEGPDQGVKIAVDGDLSISGSGFSVSITQDAQSSNYILNARANQLPISGLINQFQSEVLPSELNSLAGSLPFFSFSINNPSLSFPLSSSPLQIQLGGTPVISGYNTAHMASVIIRQGGKTLLVQGFELGAINLASFLRGITGFNFNNIAILNLDLEAAILISPVTLPNVQLTGAKLSGFSITKGISVQATMKFPPGCSSDTFCAVAQFLLGANTQLNLQGTIASATSFTLLASVSNINLGSGIVMSQAGIEIQGGMMNSVGIVGAVDLSNPDITLAARVYLSTSGVVLEMTMSGCWTNAFGASWLDICSLHASVAMIPGVTLTGLALGGEVHVGDETCGTPIVASGFVGIDVLTPTNNYYYVNIQGSTTVATILSAFCVNTNVPAPLAQSGFPRGFISSFSLAGVELPHVPLSIPLGYRLNGTLNILGLEASADVTIGLPNGIDFAVALPPINVGGLLRMSVSSSDQSRGPFLDAVITLLPTPNVNIEAKGYLSVLGISLETSLTITNTQYVFNIQGKMLNLFDANLHIAASYGNIQQATFQVQGSFTNNLYSALENLIRNSLNSAGQAASSELEAAQRELDRVRGVLNSVQSALRDGQRRVDDAQGAFDSATSEVNRLRNEVGSICNTRSCGSGEHQRLINTALI